MFSGTKFVNKIAGKTKKEAKRGTRAGANPGARSCPLEKAANFSDKKRIIRIETKQTIKAQNILGINKKKWFFFIFIHTLLNIKTYSCLKKPSKSKNARIIKHGL
jgi:hypothetical protein